MSDFFSDAGDQIDDGFSKLLTDAGNSLMKDLQMDFQKDPSKVLDVLSLMRGTTGDVPSDFPSFDNIFDGSKTASQPEITPVHNNKLPSPADITNNTQNIFVNLGQELSSNQGADNPLNKILSSITGALGVGGEGQQHSGGNGLLGGSGNLLGGLMKEVLPIAEEVLPLVALI